MAINTLSDYYASIGKTLPSWSSRFSDPAFAAAAAKAGISQSSYTGSATQNAAILQKLISSTPTKTATTPAPAPAPVKTPVTTTTKPTTTTSTPTKTSTPTQPTGVSYVYFDTSNGKAYFQQTSSGLIPVTDTTTLNKLRSNQIQAKPQTTGSNVAFAPAGTTPQTSPAITNPTGSAYMMGDYSLVRFSNDPKTVWLVDPTTRTLRPFSSSRALENFFEDPIDINSVTMLPSSALSAGGVLGSQGGQAGYELLSSEYAIQSNGTAKAIDYSSSQLQARYGQAINQQMEQEDGWLFLNGALDALKNAGVSSSTIRKIKENDTQLGFYLSALVYGGYSIADIYMDIKKRELGLSVSPISATMTKDEYMNTDEYQKAKNTNKIAPPDSIAGINTMDLDLPIYNLPSEAFKTLIPILDFESEEMQKAMDEIQTAYYDLLEQQIYARTEQEKAIADYNWEKFREDVNRSYGLQLSNNALEAWDQIEGIYNTMGGQRNIMNSGIQNETVDDYLRRVRKGDQAIRDEKMSKTEAERMAYYLTAASPEQIKALVAAEPETAAKWGLVPSAERAKELSLENLKKQYPGEKEETLMAYISSMLDENGNYRSSIYQKQMGSMLDRSGGNVNTLLGLQTAENEFRQNEALNNSLLKEEDAYRQFTTPDVAFLRTAGGEDIQKFLGTGSSTDQITNLRKLVQSGGLNLGMFSGGSQQSQSPTGSVPTGSTSGTSGVRTAVNATVQPTNTPPKTPMVPVGTGTQTGSILNNSTTGSKLTIPTGMTSLSNIDPKSLLGTSFGTSTSPLLQNFKLPTTTSTTMSPLNQTAPSATGGSSYLTNANDGGTGLVSSIKTAASSLWNKIKSPFTSSSSW